MKLHEFQTKAIFKREGIPLPASFLSSSPVQAKQAASEIGYPVILKAQSLISGRGKAGGIRLTRNDAETESAAGDIFNIKLKGISIQQILVEKAIKVENELFIGIRYDTTSGDPSFVLSVEGGISLEDNAPLSSSNSFIQTINPLLGLQAFQVRQACANLKIA
ncbi:MAG TPA: acetate--CoA ligase family protein, partial [Anaerolineaceae bacterium]|nr:acetate--CoA ligase family protein [Anaerolineaceae bacterium]